MDYKEMIFDRSEYENEAEMYQDVIKVIAALVKNNYEIAFRYGDCGYFSLRWTSANPYLGECSIEFLTPKEKELVYDWRMEKEHFNGLSA